MSFPCEKSDNQPDNKVLNTKVKTVYPLDIQSDKSSAHVRIPGSKSHTIRALLLSAFSDSPIKIHNPLYSRDTQSALALIKNWGAAVRLDEQRMEVIPRAAVVKSADVQSVLMPKNPRVDLQNSGTTLYFGTALAALGDKPLTLDGDASLRSRSASPLLQALEQCGASITEQGGNGCVPYTIRGPLRAIDNKSGAKNEIHIQCPTSQYASALLFALSFTPGGGTVCPTLAGEHPYVDMTIQWLEHFGARIRNENYERITVERGIPIPAENPGDLRIGGDYSSACFFFAAAAITKTNIAISGLWPRDTQADARVLDVLAAMGCGYEWSGDDTRGYIVTVKGSNLPSGVLRGGEFDLSDIPDALPVLCIVACYADTPTRLYNVAHARAKETDRIATMAAELTALLAPVGGRVEEHPDGITIHPCATLGGGEVRSHHDHRIAMAFAVGALGARGAVRIHDAHAADVTFPAFYKLLADIGIGTRVE